MSGRGEGRGEGRGKLEMAASSKVKHKALMDLREVGDKSGLFEACKNGDLERVASLLATDNVNSRDTAGRKSTPLHFAAGIATANNN